MWYQMLVPLEQTTRFCCDKCISAFFSLRQTFEEVCGSYSRPYFFAVEVPNDAIEKTPVISVLKGCKMGCKMGCKWVRVLAKRVSKSCRNFVLNLHSTTDSPVLVGKARQTNEQRLLGSFQWCSSRVCVLLAKQYLLFYFVQHWHCHENTSIIPFCITA